MSSEPDEIHKAYAKAYDDETLLAMWDSDELFAFDMGWHAAKGALQKRITELKAAGRDLLIEAMNLYDAANCNPNRRNARQIFEDEIKLFGLPGGGADETV